MSLTVLFLQFIFSAVILIVASRLLAKSCDEIARLTGLGHLFVGSLLLAGATSLPEFFVDIRATTDGIPNLAAGDLIGSSIANLIIFSVVTLVYRTMKKNKDDQTGSIRSTLLAILLTAEVGLFFLVSPQKGNLFGLHISSYLLMFTYLMGMRFVFRQELKAHTEDHPKSTKNFGRLLKPIGNFLLGTILIFFTAPLLVSSVEALGIQTGLGNSFLGATLLAFTTSFPEISASIVAARMGLFGLVWGNIIGSNAFNMLIFVMMDWIWKGPSLWADLSRVHAIPAGVALVNMVILLLTFQNRKKENAHLQMAGAIFVLFSSFACYLLIYFLKGHG